MIKNSKVIEIALKEYDNKMNGLFTWVCRQVVNKLDLELQNS
jgi:hypothetical protein